MPHDASVFVGRSVHLASLVQELQPVLMRSNSLPSNIDHQELTRLLSEHLSAHAEVKSIKVVRDAKGGVCAFVQCEVKPNTVAPISHVPVIDSFYSPRTLRLPPASLTFFAPSRPSRSWGDTCATSQLVL